MMKSTSDRSYDPANPHMVNAEILSGTFEAAEEFDLDLVPLLQRHLIDPEQVRNPKGFVAYHQVVNFFEDVAQQMNCPLFGFHVARHQPPMKFGLLAQLLKLCATAGESLEKGLRYSQLYNQVSDWELVKEADFVFLKRRHRVIYPGSLVQFHFLAVTLMIKATVGISLSPGALVSVSFSHARPDNDGALSRLFNCPVYYDQDYDGFSFPAAFLEIPLPTSDPALLAMMEDYLSGLLKADSPNETLPVRVQQFIRKNLGTSICNLEGVAHLLGQHPRALQRALKNEDTSFRELLSDVRQQVAEQYLRSSDIAFTDLSDILGYRNVSAFSRAFKEATGLSPQHWKDLHA